MAIKRSGAKLACDAGEAAQINNLIEMMTDANFLGLTFSPHGKVQIVRTDTCTNLPHQGRIRKVRVGSDIGAVRDGGHARGGVNKRKKRTNTDDTCDYNC